MPSFYDPSTQPGRRGTRSSRVGDVGDECFSAAAAAAAGMPTWWLWTPVPRIDECEERPAAAFVSKIYETVGNVLRGD